MELRSFYLSSMCFYYGRAGVNLKKLAPERPAPSIMQKKWNSKRVLRLMITVLRCAAQYIVVVFIVELRIWCQQLCE